MRKYLESLTCTKNTYFISYLKKIIFRYLLCAISVLYKNSPPPYKKLKGKIYSHKCWVLGTLKYLCLCA